MGLDYSLNLDWELYRDFKKNENYFSYILLQIWERKFAVFPFNNVENLTKITAGASCTPDMKIVGELKTKLNPEHFSNLQIIISAGGFNNEIYLAERISDKMYFNNKNNRLLYYLQYLRNRWAPIRYNSYYFGDDIVADPYSIVTNFFALTSYRY